MLIALNCSICRKPFERARGEVKRNQKLNRPIYCSRSCAGTGNLKNIPAELIGSTRFLKRGGRVPNEFSPYRQALRIARSRATGCGRDFDLTLQDLKEIWEKQNGICPYTGWAMYLPKSVGEYSRRCGEDNPRKASLDRIDSSQGYIKGNVQFVCHMANVAKHSYSHDTMVEFCRAVAEHWK